MKKLIILFLLVGSCYAYCQTNDSLKYIYWVVNQTKGDSFLSTQPIMLKSKSSGESAILVVYKRKSEIIIEIRDLNGCVDNNTKTYFRFSNDIYFSIVGNQKFNCDGEWFINRWIVIKWMGFFTKINKFKTNILLSVEVYKYNTSSEFTIDKADQLYLKNAMIELLN